MVGGRTELALESLQAVGGAEEEGKVKAAQSGLGMLGRAQL